MSRQKILLLQKTYEKSGYFVSSVSIEDYTMHLNRIQYNGTAYVPADQDMIMNREGDSGKLVNIANEQFCGKGDPGTAYDCRGIRGKGAEASHPEGDDFRRGAHGGNQGRGQHKALLCIREGECGAGDR